MFVYKLNNGKVGIWFQGLHCNNYHIIYMCLNQKWFACQVLELLLVPLKSLNCVNDRFNVADVPLRYTLRL